MLRFVKTSLRGSSGDGEGINKNATAACLFADSFQPDSTGKRGPCSEGMDWAGVSGKLSLKQSGLMGIFCLTVIRPQSLAFCPCNEAAWL